VFEKRNILDEGRMFNDEWFIKYFVVLKGLFAWLVEMKLLVWKNLIRNGTITPGIQYNTREF